MLDSLQMLDCKFGPNEIEIEISLMDYEIMCKYTVDRNFCQCET